MIKWLDDYLDPHLTDGEKDELREAVLAHDDAVALVTEQESHYPEVAQRQAGEWGVFCHGCSNLEGDYVYPCIVRPGDHWPPKTLYEGKPS
jgi:hypothetical protein